METTIQFGNITASALLAGILAIVYKVSGDSIPDRFRALIAVAFGIIIGLIYIPYSGRRMHLYLRG